MRKTVVILLILLCCTLQLAQAQNVNILLILPNNYGANYNFNIDNFERFGWHVTTAGLTKSVNPCAAFATSVGCKAIEVDSLIDEIKDITNYDCVALMPVTWQIGDPYSDIMESQKAMELIKTAVDSNIIVWATCAGVRVLAKADALRGRYITGQDAYKNEFTAAGAIFLGGDHPPVTDGNIITSVRGQYYHVQNCDAIKAALEKKGILASKPNSEDEFSSNDISGVSNTVWLKTFGGNDSEGGKSIIETNDGGFVIAGYTYSFGEGFSDAYLIKTDSDGNEIWTKTFGGSGWEYSYSVIQTKDNGFAITGYTTSTGSGERDVYLVKTDADGNLEWSKTYGGEKEDVGRSVAQTEDGGFIICGYTKSFTNGEEDIYLVRTNASGDTLWTKSHGYDRFEVGMDVRISGGGGFIVAGATGSQNISAGNSDFYLLNFDASGNLLWEKTYNNPTSSHPFDWGNSFCITHDGNFVLAGDSDVRSPLEMYLVKANSEGELIWKKNFGENFYDYGNSVLETDDGGYIVCGTTKSIDSGKNDVYLIRADVDGNQIWKKFIGGSESDWGDAVCQTKDGNFVIVGHTNSYGAGGFDVMLLKISSLYPRFNAAPTSGHAPLKVCFTDETLGNVSSWEWDFNNDGIIDSHEQNPEWTYEEPGNYTVCLIASGNSASDTLRYENMVRAFNGESALSFDGALSSVNCKASPSLNFVENLTIEAWIYPCGWGENTTLGFGRIVDKTKFSFFLINSSPSFNDHSLAFQLVNSDGTNSFSMTPENSIELNKWQHVAVTYNANNSEVKMYIDGAEQSLKQTKSPSGNIADNNTEDLYLGNNKSKAFTFDGIIDEVRIWNTVRTSAEISAMKDCKLTKTKPDLAGCWGMNEGTGDEIHDISGNNNLGEVNDAAWIQSLSLTPTSIKSAEDHAPVSDYLLYDNYPNPFNPETTIRFEIPVKDFIELSIYDIQGRCLKTLYSGEETQGVHSIKWDGTDRFGQKVSSGLYFYKLSAKAFTDTKKMLLIK